MAFRWRADDGIWILPPLKKTLLKLTSSDKTFLIRAWQALFPKIKSSSGTEVQLYLEIRARNPLTYTMNLFWNHCFKADGRIH